MRESRASLSQQIAAQRKRAEDAEQRTRDILDAVLDVFDLHSKYPDEKPPEKKGKDGWTYSYHVAYNVLRAGRDDFRDDLLLAAKDAKSSAAYQKIRGTK